MQLPLLHLSKLPLLRNRNQVVERAELAALATALAAGLPKCGYAINLCEDRYHFMLGFAAACLAGQTNLLPASQTPNAILAAKGYGTHHVFDDQSLGAWLAGTSAPPPTASLQVAAEHSAAICFTSGSTGLAQAHASSWRVLTDSARRSAAGIFTEPGLNVVATVPPQHMFGLETSILQPLLGTCCVHSQRPFFPRDICAALLQMPAPRALVTTPQHLRACRATALPTDVEFVLSATAALPLELAAHIETHWRTRVLEIYGSTETGAIAWRRTVDGDTWTLLPGGTLRPMDNATDGRIGYVSGTDNAIPLHDTLQPLDTGRFILQGRSSDLVKVAGKRASLANLNATLQAVPGVKDSVLFQPEPDGRLAALVVVDGIDARAIAQALAAQVDEVFLPRPLRIVAALPRDALGKLPRKDLLAALDLS